MVATRCPYRPRNTVCIRREDDLTPRTDLTTGGRTKPPRTASAISDPTSGVSRDAGPATLWIDSRSPPTPIAKSATEGRRGEPAFSRGPASRVTAGHSLTVIRPAEPEQSCAQVTRRGCTPPRPGTDPGGQRVLHRAVKGKRGGGPVRTACGRRTRCRYPTRPRWVPTRPRCPIEAQRRRPASAPPPSHLSQSEGLLGI